MLGEFCKVLSKKALSWLNEKWDLCPLLQRASEKMDDLSPRKLMPTSLMRDVDASADDSESSREFTEYILDICFNLNRFMDSWKASENVYVTTIPNATWISDNELRIKLDGRTGGIDLSKVKLTTKPQYSYSENLKSDYDIVGYMLQSKSSTLRFKADQVITSVDFGGKQHLTIYAAWNPEYILEFISDNTHYQDGQVSGNMATVKLASVGNKAPECAFNHPGETRKKFQYQYCPTGAEYEWQNNDVINDYNSEDDTTNPTVYLYGFKEWVYTIDGIRHTIHENEPLTIEGFNLQCRPVITMKAYWERAYDILKFNVDGKTYCEVCIDVNVNRVEYPNHAPVIQPKDGRWKFYNWNCAEGDYLSGVNRSPIVICGTESNPIVREDGALPIVCKEDEIDYDVPIEAYIVEYKERKFRVTFRYMSDSGVPTEHIEENIP